MRSGRGLFPWWVTRTVFLAGVMALTSFALRCVLSSASVFTWVLIPVGLALVALATRGPWDSTASGRNRSVLGFRARTDENR
jgi:hypothetical protein